MNKVHGEIEEERLLFISRDEVDAEGVDDIRVIDFLTGIHLLAVLFIRVLPEPAASGGIGHIFIKAPVTRRLADLPPLARLCHDIAALLQNLCDERFVSRLRTRSVSAPRTIANATRAEDVAPRHQQTARWPAQRSGITRRGPRETWPRRAPFLQ